MSTIYSSIPNSNNNKMAIQGNPRFRNVLIVGNTEDDQIFGED